MNVDTDVVTTVTVTVTLTEDEAARLGGLLIAAPTSDPFFQGLAEELDVAIAPFLAIYEANEEGIFEQQEEV